MEFELFTVQEVSQKLKLSKSYLYELVSKQRIPYHKFGSAVRFSGKDVEWILKNTHKTINKTWMT